MASPISCLSILIIPLLVTSLFYDVSNADQALVEKVCKKSMDYNFCRQTLLSDPEGLTNVLYKLGLVSTDVSLNIISDVISGEIPNALAGVTDIFVRTRVKECQTDIDDLYTEMKLAYNAAGTQSYAEETTHLTSAQQKITVCDKRFESLPTHQSPISSSTSKITKLINISSVIVSMITSS
ncbi:uncharacterized protein LOC126727693 [Quercus robur]|uniref:uncharacterized protein LOC126727693 n=1 Tax=Quercus robur TaxID=38942 RepID=UPI0021623645|nr:uncharacterized protein LOC126727693 [Quercus robur]